jgi:hypothetical protein
MYKIDAGGMADGEKLQKMTIVTDDGYNGERSH